MPWTEADDKLLLKARSQGNTWTMIQSLYPSRTDASVKHRHRRLRFKWNSWQDQLLVTGLCEGRSFENIQSSFLPYKTVDQLWERYSEISRPPQKRYTPWSDAEDNQLLTASREGKSWAEIHQLFPNRTNRAVERRYNILSKTELPRQSEISCPHPSALRME